jgi:hypothetical protein
MNGFPQLLWDTLWRLGYTEKPIYYTCAYEEGGVPKYEARLRIPEHPECPDMRSRYVYATGREYSITVQKAARQAITEFCVAFEEDIEHTPARFYPVPDQSTPTWNLKIEDLQKIDVKAPEFTMVTTVVYMHALDILYDYQKEEMERQAREKEEIQRELYDARLRLREDSKEKARLKLELASCYQDLQVAQHQIQKKKHPRKKTRSIARRPIAAGACKGKAVYNPDHPHYRLDEYISRESYSEQETIVTAESVADNLQGINARWANGHVGTSGHARDL